MRLYDVVIIGGGVTGSAVAKELSRYKLRIALLEKEAELAFGVSKSNSGIIHPGTQNPPRSLKGKLCVQGNRLMRRLSRELGFDFKEVGELIVAFTGEDIEQLMKLKKDAELLGVRGLRIVGRKWLERNEPNLNREAVAALYAPTAGIVSPYRVVYGLAENAAGNGAEIYTETAVKDMAVSHPKNGGRPVFEIYTTKGTFLSRYVVNAAGLFADDIARMAGINDFVIKPRKGEEFILDKKRQYITNHLLFPLPAKASKGVLVIKTSDGNPMIGPTADDADKKDDLSTSDGGFRKVIDSVKRLVPSIDENDIIAYFAGLRPAAGDDFIIRHENRAPGFVNVAGIQSPGLTAAPAIAIMVAAILMQHGLRLEKRWSFRRYREKTAHLFAIPLRATKRLIENDSQYGDMVCRCEMVSAKEIKDAIRRGAVTMDGVKFRTRAQAGRCHGSFCTTRIMKILAEETGRPLTSITKRGGGSEVVLGERENG